MTQAAGIGAHPGLMKLLAPVSAHEEVAPLIAAGAEEIYCGLVPAAWVSGEDPAHWLNRRSARGANLHSIGELRAVLASAHDRAVPVFLTLNAHHYQQRQIPLIVEMARVLGAEGVDALIVSDLTLIGALRDGGVYVPVHLSSLGVCINAEAARFYADLGVRRIILPRHLSLPEIGAVVSAVPEVEFEVFLLNDGCVYEEGHCLTTHEWGAFCLEDWSFEFRPLSEEAAARHRAAWDDTLADYQRFRWFQNNAGCSTTARGLPNGPCSLCFLPRFAEAGVASLKVVGREAAAIRKLASVQLAGAVLRTWRETHAPEAVAARARGLRDTPDLCDSGYMCYFR
ncbi:MAG: U32 family peptidase [Candidatus Sericytochromatia bacterium]|nr:U32 family peptidase [Candidatus Tanganyikabacteria bacterium]